MTALLDDLLVGVVLLAAFGYAICALGPKVLRARLLTGTASLLGRLPTAGVRGVAERMAVAAAKAGSSCGGCDNCGSNAAAKGPGVPRIGSGDVPGDGPAAVPEVRVPLAKIGKRRVS